jgi:predicted membrane protein
MMISHTWRRVTGVIIVGLALKFGSPLIRLLDLPTPLRTWAFLVPYLLGTAVYLWGCSLFAQAKNQSRLWGLTGFLCVFAVPILYFLSDRCPLAPVEPKTN